MLNRQMFFIYAGLILVFSSGCNSLAPNSSDKIGAASHKVSPPVRDNSRIDGSARISSPEKHHRQTYKLEGAEELKLDNYYFDLPVVYNDAVKKWMHYFLNRGRDYFTRYSERSGRYAPVMGKILEEEGLPRDLIFVAMAESGFHNQAKSWAQAVGPWQFMPATGKRYGLGIDWYIDERRDPIKATLAASKYLQKLYEEFGCWELAAAAYNAGEGKVGRAIKRYRTEDFWRLRQGRYLKAETKNYVPKIMALAIIGKNLTAFGFDELEFHEPLDFEEVIVPGNTDLVELSKDLNVEFEEIQRLNPEVLRWFIPAHIKDYRLRLPVGFKSAFVKLDLKYYQSEFFETYTVRGKSATLTDIGNKVKVKHYVLKDLNPHLAAHAALKKDTVVKLPFRIGQDRKDPMYADLYEKPRKEVVRKRDYSYRIKLAQKRGKKIVRPTEYYLVQKGDTLWSVARKAGVSLDTLIVSNIDVISSRMIREGDRLIVR